MEDFSRGEIYTLVAAFPIMFATVAKWILTDYINKTTELRDNKIKEVKKDVDNLGQKNRDLESYMKVIQGEIGNINIEIGKLSVHVENLGKRR
jgi:peptidoglycan hydrolase CwlO-like protein